MTVPADAAVMIVGSEKFRRMASYPPVMLESAALTGPPRWELLRAENDGVRETSAQDQPQRSEGTFGSRLRIEMPDDSPQSVPGAIRRRLRGFLLVSFKSLSVRLGGETSAPTRLWERTAPPIVCQR